MTDFERATAAQEHAEEIQNTRIGGLGGSDAALVLRVGMYGLGALTATDHKRLAVMRGMIKQNAWGGNAATNAGHKYEEYITRALLDRKVEFGDSMPIAEFYMQAKMARSFKTFAHADFYEPKSGKVLECKYVQDETEAVADKYEAQLQWYYMLGANKVCLAHGRGDVEPFKVAESKFVLIERDEKIIDALFCGLRTLDQAFESGWTPVVSEIATEDELPAKISEAVKRIKELTERMDEEEKELAELKGVLMSYMNDMATSAILADGMRIGIKKGGMTRTFDAKKVLKEHPELDCDENYKVSKRSDSLTISNTNK